MCVCVRACVRACVCVSVCVWTQSTHSCTSEDTGSALFSSVSLGAVFDFPHCTNRKKKGLYLYIHMSEL